MRSLDRTPRSPADFRGSGTGYFVELLQPLLHDRQFLAHDVMRLIRSAIMSNNSTPRVRYRFPPDGPAAASDRCAACVHWNSKTQLRLRRLRRWVSPGTDCSHNPRPDPFFKEISRDGVDFRDGVRPWIVTMLVREGEGGWHHPDGVTDTGTLISRGASLKVRRSGGTPHPEL